MCRSVLYLTKSDVKYISPWTVMMFVKVLPGSLFQHVLIHVGLCQYIRLYTSDYWIPFSNTCKSVYWIPSFCYVSLLDPFFLLHVRQSTGSLSSLRQSTGSLFPLRQSPGSLFLLRQSTESLLPLCQCAGSLFLLYQSS